jgi:hypothetical protein
MAMTKKGSHIIFYTATGLVVLAFVTALVFANHSTSSSEAGQNNASSVQSSSTSSVARSKIYVFPGSVTSKVGSEPMNGVPAQQFNVKVDDRTLFTDQSGGMYGTVVISTTNRNVQIKNGVYRIKATYDSGHKWYVVQSIGLVQIDY